MPLGRLFLQRLAESRLNEGKALLAAGHPAAAYYLAGYAGELGLKACIARQFKADEIPDWALSREFRTHGIMKLIALAGLTTALETELAANQSFSLSWQAAVTWHVDTRYDLSVTWELASQLITSLDDPENGVLRWIRTHW